MYILCNRNFPLLMLNICSENDCINRSFCNWTRIFMVKYNVLINLYRYDCFKNALIFSKHVAREMFLNFWMKSLTAASESPRKVCHNRSEFSSIYRDHYVNTSGPQYNNPIGHFSILAKLKRLLNASLCCLLRKDLCKRSMVF